MGYVGRDIPHDSAVAHATGRSQFVDDIPSARDELFVAVVGSPVAHGRLRAIDAAAARGVPGVVAVLDHTSIPGRNDVGPVVPDEHLLVAETAVFLGDPVVVIAAETREAALAARRLVRVEMEELLPTFTIEDAIARRQFIGPPRLIERGEAEAALREAPLVVSGELHTGGQDHFYFESQAAIAYPQEGGGMIVHSSTQHPSEVQATIAHVLDLPFNAVSVLCKRMGGGFGGKETQAAGPAAIAALVAFRTGRPARIVYDKDDDMRVTGKRHPFLGRYQVGFDRAGRLLALQLELFSNGGCSTDLSPAVLERAMLHADNAYYIPNFRVIGRICRTNLPSNTAFRGFGGPQGVANVENVIEEVARHLGLDAVEVRERNLYGAPVGTQRPSPPPSPTCGDGDRVAAQTGARGRGSEVEDLFAPPPTSDGDGDPFSSAPRRAERERPSSLSRERSQAPFAHDDSSLVGGGGGEGLARPAAPAELEMTPYGQIIPNLVLPALIRQLRASADYDRRRAAVRAFNAQSATHVRGLALTPVKFGISFTRQTLNQANAQVLLYTDGTVLVTTGATEMGQGVHTRIAQLVADELGVAMTSVRVGTTDTSRNNNTSPSAASATTDLNGAAAVHACEILRGRLAEFAAAHLFADAAAGLAPSPAHVRFAEGLVFDARRPERQLAFADVVTQAYVHRIDLGARGFYATPGVDFNRDTGRGNPFLYFTQGAAAAEVEVDRLTGETRTLRVDLLMDAGVPLNPGIDRGQVVGGFVQGMGWCTTEELCYDAAGNLLSHSPTTYKIPAITDVPPIFNVAFFDNPHSTASLKRSKALGEPPLLLAVSVWAAIKDAVAQVSTAGAQKLDLPATPQEILTRMTRESTQDLLADEEAGEVARGNMKT